LEALQWQGLGVKILTRLRAHVLFKSWVGNLMYVQVEGACIFEEILLEIQAEILSEILSDILKEIQSNILLEIQTKILLDIQQEIHKKILSDILLEILTYTA
jgi:hypothetical protein